jgi:L-amino acid N-acyltransferase YncA
MFWQLPPADPGMDTLAHPLLDSAPMRLTRPVDLNRLLAFASQRDMRQILHGQNIQPEVFFSGDGPNPARDLYAVEEAGEVTGWACTHKFHERPGYAPALRYDTDFRTHAAATALFSACAAAAAASGTRRFVSLVRSDAHDRLRWYRSGVFLQAGTLALPADLELFVFIRALAA